MSNSNVSFDFGSQGLEDLGLILSSRLDDLGEFFDSSEFNKIVGTYFDDMFRSSNNGKWTISQKWAAKKKSMGYSEKPNIMTKRLQSAMSFPVNASFSINQGALREVSSDGMKWGVDINDPMFEMNGSYPEIVAKKNPFAVASNDMLEDVAVEAVKYLLKKQRSI